MPHKMTCGIKEKDQFLTYAKEDAEEISAVADLEAKQTVADVKGFLAKAQTKLGKFTKDQKALTPGAAELKESTYLIDAGDRAVH